MKEILRQNKDMVLNFFLTGVLIAMIASWGLGYIGSGAGTLVQNTDYESHTDAAQFKNVAALPAPALKCREEEQWKTGMAIVVGQAFRATDHAGRELEIKILQVRNEAGDDLTARYQESTGEITFDEAGCYYFKLQTTDDNRKVTTEELPLVVDRAG